MAQCLLVPCMVASSVGRPEPVTLAVSGSYSAEPTGRDAA